MNIAMEIMIRLIMVVFFFVYPVLLLLSAPFAWLSSLGTVGYTNWKEWKGEWRLYHWSSVVDFWKEVFSPIK